MYGRKNVLQTNKCLECGILNVYKVHKNWSKYIIYKRKACAYIYIICIYVKKSTCSTHKGCKANKRKDLKFIFIYYDTVQEFQNYFYFIMCMMCLQYTQIYYIQCQYRTYMQIYNLLYLNLSHMFLGVRICACYGIALHER